MKRESAEVVSAVMLEFGRRLDETVALVCNTERDQNEAQRYKRAVGRILGEMLIEVLNPLYAEHPELKPPHLR
jgi:hypothetical protein